MCMTVRTNKKLKFPDDLKLSKDKNMMISDIGATCESTPHEADIKLRKIERQEIVPPMQVVLTWLKICWKCACKQMQ